MSTPTTTWHPEPDSLCEGHVVHTRNPIPDAWEQGGIDTAALTRYTPAQRSAALAHHEAGHAVAWTLCGVEVERITLGGPGGLGAAVHPRSDGCAVSSLLVGLAAGHVAEARFLAEAGLYTPERAWAAERLAETDQRGADRLCRKYLDRPLTYGVGADAGDWGRASEIAGTMLGVSWGAVACLAEELVLCWEEGETVMPGRVVRQFIGA